MSEGVSPGFDLTDRAWIPVRSGGRVRDVGLRGLFTRAAELDDVVVPVPPAAPGLWRVLYALTARVTGLDDPDVARDPVAWRRRQRDVLGAGSFDGSRVEAYFQQWADRFDLFGPRPWMQDARLAHQCPKTAGINKLVVGRPAGQNQVWFTHFTDVSPSQIPAREAAWYLLVQLYYGPSGRCSTRTVVGTSEANTTAGPLRSALSYHPVGRNLFESLVLGVPAPPGESARGEDRCVWELDELPHPLGVPLRPTWPGGLLTARARHAVLLVPSVDGEQVADAYITWAHRKQSAPCVDPYVIQNYSKAGDSFYSRPADADRALWRDLDALLLKNSARTQPRRPTVFNDFDDLPEEVVDAVRVRAYGFDQDGQTRDRQWFTAITPPVLGWLEERDPRAWNRITDAREAAEDVERSLEWVLKEAWRRVISPPSMEAGRSSGKVPPGPWPSRARAWYWPRAEGEFWGIARGEADGSPPRDAFVRLARQAIDHAVGTAERGMKAARALSWARAVVGRTGQQRKAS